MWNWTREQPFGETAGPQSRQMLMKSIHSIAAPPYNPQTPYRINTFLDLQASQSASRSSLKLYLDPQHRNWRNDGQTNCRRKSPLNLSPSIDVPAIPFALKKSRVDGEAMLMQRYR